MFTFEDVLIILRTAGDADPETTVVTLLATKDETGLPMSIVVKLRSGLSNLL